LRIYELVTAIDNSEEIRDICDERAAGKQIALVYSHSDFGSEPVYDMDVRNDADQAYLKELPCQLV